MEAKTKMAKYTTLVRTICEQKADLDENVGFSQVDNVIAQSWDKIFTTQVEFWKEEYRQVLCSKILKHYYMREIAAETVGLWQLWINTRLEEIMPYYNQLYESATLEFDPLSNVKYTREHSGNNNENYQGSGENSSVDYNLHSDTPQGGLAGLDDGNYMSDASKNDGSSENSYRRETVRGFTESETISGKYGDRSLSKMLNDYRETFLNIDMMVIEEFEDCFFGLW